ncbi:MAG: alpha-mannosidase [Chloroflexi bacterium]|nr:alpha-mannosidase [Chloroflexota bacterium]
MQRHPELTRQRLEKFAQYLKTLVYPTTTACALEAYAAPGRISYAEALAGDYRPVKLYDRLQPAWSTHWFRLRLTIPVEWQGQEVHLLWDSSSEACVWQDGQPRQGLAGSGDYWHSPYHDAYTLSEKARGGQQIELYIETAINTPFGITDTSALTTLGVLRRAEMAVFRRDIWDLLWDFVTVADMARCLPADSPRAGQALRAANRMVNLFQPEQPESITAARAEAAHFLAATNGAGQHTVYAIGHAHIDTAWLWPLAETRRKCIRTFSTVMRLMERYPDYQFVCSQAQQLAWIKESQPALYAQIQQRVAEGRFIPVGGAWVEPDCNIPSGEALARQFLYGQRFYQQEFGWQPREFWLPDTFGYPAGLPQILRGAGIDHFLTQKLSWNQFNKPAMSTFYWQGLDGSRVLTHFPPTETYGGLANVEELVRGVRNFRDHERSNVSLYLFGFGDGGGGPNEAMLERLQRMRDVDGLPRLQMDTPSAFFAAAETPDLTTWVGELYFELHRGTYTSQARTKLGNRRSELLLRDAEFLAALLPDYPQSELERLWKLTLLNQFHDILPGSSITAVYEDAARDYAEIARSGAALRQRALETLLAEGEQIAAVNTLSQARREVVEAPFAAASAQHSADGHPLLLLQAPPMGYRVQDGHTEGAAVTIREENGAFVLENALLRATIGADGTLISLYSKTLARETLRAAGNRFVLFDDRPLAWEAWDVDVFHREKRRDVAGAHSAHVVESGPLRAAVRFTYRLGDKSALRQIIRLDCAAAYVEFVTEVDWHERQQFLKVEFDLNVHTTQAMYETQYGVVPRPTHYNTSWDLARFEVCAQRWGALTEYGFGAALLNDCKYGYSAYGSRLALSLLRSPTYPDPQADQGAHTFRYALLPFDGRLEQAVAAGLRFNVPLLVRRCAAQGEQSFFSVEPGHVVLDAVKKAEDSDALIVRLYEACGGRATVRLRSALDIAWAKRCNLLEAESGDVAWQAGGAQFEIAPFETVTLKLGR